MENNFITCQNCQKQVDLNITPEIAMGATRCPHCNSVFDNNGSIIKIATQPSFKEGDRVMDIRDSSIGTVKNIQLPFEFGSAQYNVKFDNEMKNDVDEKYLRLIKGGQVNSWLSKKIESKLQGIGVIAKRVPPLREWRERKHDFITVYHPDRYMTFKEFVTNNWDIYGFDFDIDKQVIWPLKGTSTEKLVKDLKEDGIDTKVMTMSYEDMFGDYYRLFKIPVPQRASLPTIAVEKALEKKFIQVLDDGTEADFPIDNIADKFRPLVDEMKIGELMSLGPLKIKRIAETKALLKKEAVDVKTLEGRKFKDRNSGEILTFQYEHRHPITRDIVNIVFEDKDGVEVALRSWDEVDIQPLETKKGSLNKQSDLGGISNSVLVVIEDNKEFSPEGIEHWAKEENINIDELNRTLAYLLETQMINKKDNIYSITAQGKQYLKDTGFIKNVASLERKAALENLAVVSRKFSGLLVGIAQYALTNLLNEEDPQIKTASASYNSQVSLMDIHTDVNKITPVISSVTATYKNMIIEAALNYGDFTISCYAPTRDEAHEWIEKLETKMLNENQYRGKCLYAENGNISFHQVPEVVWDDIILDANIKSDIRMNTIAFLGDKRLADTGVFKRGIVMYGQPGTGKTSVVKAIFNELNEKGVSRVYVTSESFRQMSASSLFSLLPYLGKAVIAFEDIDMIGTSRDIMSMSGNGILGDLLTNLDGMRNYNEQIVILASTNKMSMLDEALADRPGRFDRKVEITLPTKENLTALYKKFSGLTVSSDIINLSEGFTGSHVVETVNTAKILAAHDNKKIDDCMIEACNIIRDNFFVGQKQSQIKTAALHKIGIVERGEQYKSLNDADKIDPIFIPGNTEIWYAKSISTANRMYDEEKMPFSKETFKDTHMLLGKVSSTDLDEIFQKMQGEYWSPRGEAFTMIGDSETDHTSMSVGDAIKIGDVISIVAPEGFKPLAELKKETKWLGFKFNPGDKVELISGDYQGKAGTVIRYEDDYVLVRTEEKEIKCQPETLKKLSSLNKQAKVTIEETVVDLDPLEARIYNDLILKSKVSPKKALEIMWNTLEGDYTQLSPALLKYVQDHLEKKSWLNKKAADRKELSDTVYDDSDFDGDFKINEDNYVIEILEKLFDKDYYKEIEATENIPTKEMQSIIDDIVDYYEEISDIVTDFDNWEDNIIDGYVESSSLRDSADNEIYDIQKSILPLEKKLVTMIYDFVEKK